ncbi:MAG: alpha-amylase/alpha-mannosidase [Gemmataceae bacterium]|nr:alpha-amylase/alpha-mannosidase [Gemmataceae bacterium]
MPNVALAFYWHQHQPYYPDDQTGENAFPWVRLHGVKDYVGMALHLLEYPEMCCTINLVPSLLVQILAYTEKGATDRFLQVARIPAKDLSRQDATFLLDHYFMANHEHMLKPWPRFWELLQLRAANKQSAAESLRRFGERELRDLQTLYNLAWIHPLVFEADAELQQLRAKGKLFTEAEKNWVLDKHIAIMKQIIPLHRKLAESGQVELTTTPFYHPILPLLFDKRLAREAMPDVKLPRHTAGYLDDAETQVRRAVQQHAALFGAPPKGMWPAEGSVCQAMLPMLAKHGIRWIATDEGVLNQSTHGFVSRDAHGHLRNPSHLYRPYGVREGEHQLGIVFRDHALSDRIGFDYQRSSGHDAAHDFIRHLHNIRDAILADQPVLVSVILDGENCWEHYPESGVPFLRTLYKLCVQDRRIEPVKIGEYLEENPPKDTLPRLFAGSWIHNNFAIWVGHDEDNTAWDALHRTREHLVHRAAQSSIPAEQLQRAWEELYIAEGSDWFWWYGDDHSCAQDALFDQLFRKHLQNVYLALGDVPPVDLNRAIKKLGQRQSHTLPTAFLDVKIDGRTTFFEWSNAGRFECQAERGAMAMVTQTPIRELHFGFSRREFLLRIDFDEVAKTCLRGYDILCIGFDEPSGYELRILQPAQPVQSWCWYVNDKPMPTAEGVQLAIDRVIECAIPFALLEAKPNRPLRFFVELLQNQQSRDRAPRDGAIALSTPSENFERIHWDV